MSHLVVSYLFVNLGELLKVVLKKGDLLLLGCAAAGVVRVHLSALRRYTQYNIHTSSENSSFNPNKTKHTVVYLAAPSLILLMNLNSFSVVCMTNGHSLDSQFPSAPTGPSSKDTPKPVTLDEQRERNGSGCCASPSSLW